MAGVCRPGRAAARELRRDGRPRIRRGHMARPRPTESATVTHPLVAYYVEVLNETYLMAGMGWSVVEGIDAPVTVAEVVRRLGGDPAELFELPAEEAFDADACEALVCLAPHGSAVALFEPGSPQAVRPEVLRRLSAGARG